MARLIITVYILHFQLLFATTIQPNFSPQEREWIKNNPVVVVGGERDWPPFDYVEDGKYVGIAKDYLDLISQKSGLRFDVKTQYSWSELLDLAKAKKIDLLPMIYISEERKKFLHFSNAYLTIRHYLYTLENKKFNRIEDLFGKRVAVPKGFAQATILRQKYPQIDLYEAGNSLACIDAVMTKKADALIENTALLSYYIKHQKIKGIKAAFPPNLGVNRLYMATTGEHRVLRDIVQKSLNAISLEEKEEIEKKWLIYEKSDHQYLWNILVVTFLILIVLMLLLYLLNRKIKREVEKQTNLQNYLQNLTNNTFDAIATIDHEGKIITWNKSCEKIFGYSYDDMEGKNLHQIIMPPEFMPKHQKGFALFQKSGKGVLVGKVLEVEAIDKQGVRIPIEISVNSIKYEDKWHALGIIRDLRDRKRLESRVLEVERQNQEIDSIINGSTTILMLNDHKEMIRANQAFFDFFDRYADYHAFRQKHQCICEFFVLMAEVDYIDQAYIDGLYWVEYLVQAPSQHYKIAIKKQKKLHHFLIHVSSIVLQEKRLYLIELIDITPEKELEKEFIQARDKAQHASESKSIFLANMSHEIRTPLNGIIGLTDIVLQSDLQRQQYSYLSKVKTSSQALLNVINDVLDYSKAEANKLRLNENAFVFNELIHSIKDLFGYRMDQKGLMLIFDVDSSIPQNLVGDKLRLIQVLNNFVGNGVKFTDQGSIKVVIKERARDDKYVQLEFCIIDSGIGIDAKDQEKLFKPFSQVDSSNTKAYGGTGLGLVISKEIVELMGGEISLSSHKGVGSQFCFTLSLEYLATQYQEKHPSQVKEKRVFSGRVLVVEDDETNQIVAREYLSSYGMEVRVASNGEEALKYVGQESFDIIFMDIQMPIMDGFSASKAMRKMGISTPIIALSAAVMQSDRELSKVAQMDGHIAKPIDKEALEGVLEHYFESQWLTTTPSASTLPPIQLYGINLTALLEDLPYEQVSTMLLKYAYSYGDFAQKLDGMPHDSQEFAQYIHKLKGVSGNLKADKVYSLLLAIQRAKKSDKVALIEQLKKELSLVIASILDKISLFTQNKKKLLLDTQSIQVRIANLIEDINANNFIQSAVVDALLDDLEDLIDNDQKELLKEAFLDYNYDTLKKILFEIKEGIANA